MMLVISLLTFLGLYQNSGKASTKGKAEYERICGACHQLGVGTANPRTRAQWSEVVDDMAAMGAAGTKSELKLVIDYLTSNFGIK